MSLEALVDFILFGTESIRKYSMLAHFSFICERMHFLFKLIKRVRTVNTMGTQFSIHREYFR